MVTVADIQGIINEMGNLMYMVAAMNKITSCNNQFNVKMPITGKEIEISIPQSDIDDIDSEIETKKTELKNMWKAITW